MRSFCRPEKFHRKYRQYDFTQQQYDASVAAEQAAAATVQSAQSAVAMQESRTAQASAEAQGARRWKATVALDSAALDVVSIMQRRHLGLYDRAFGQDPAQWRRLSPLQQLRAQAVPAIQGA